MTHRALLFVFFFAVSIAAIASAQGQVPELPTPVELAAQRSRRLPMDSVLQDMGRLPAGLSAADARAFAERSRVGMDSAGRVHVELVAAEGGEAPPDGVVTSRGGRVDTRWRNRLDAWVPRGALVPLAASLPFGVHMVRAGACEPDDVVGEGRAALGTDTYLQGGIDGTGVTVAIIDLGFQGLTAARGNGDAPSTAMATEINYTASAFESGGTHGTGCVETVFDHCPGATFRLYKIDSEADLGAAVSNAIAAGAEVVSHSISWFNDGWADDSGSVCAAANAASAGGAQFFTSAGNYAQSHWQGAFDPGTGSSAIHDWVNGDETLDITLAPSEGVTLYLSWDTGSGTADYDLYLYDASNNLLVSSTAGGSTFEWVSYTNLGPTTQTVHATVVLFSGVTLQIELFGTGGGFEHIVSAGSTTAPSNATGTNVFSVGAVDWNSFSLGSGATGILESYSSQGPSNGGLTLPDLVGPTNTSGFTYPLALGGFGGTSCATPNAAGATVVFRATLGAYTDSAVTWLLTQQASLHRDWGTPGTENLYGAGGASLVTYAAGTVWLARDWGNTGNLTTGPYYTLDAAYAGVSTGGRIVSLPGNYPEHPSGPMTKNHNIESYDGSSVMGF